MKYCTHCGAELYEGDSFCTRCGTPIPEESVQTVPAVENASAEESAPSEDASVPESPIPFTPTAENPFGPYANYGTAPYEKRRKMPFWAMVCCSVVFWILLVLFCLFLYGDRQALKWGMSGAEVADALEEEGFLPEPENGTVFAAYSPTLGEMKLECHYNDAGQLYGVTLLVDNEAALLPYAQEHFGEYERKNVDTETFFVKETEDTISLLTAGVNSMSWISLELTPEALYPDLSRMIELFR